MKTKTLLAAALLALAFNLRAQPVPPLLYSQTSPVTVANTTDFAYLSSGAIYGTKVISVGGLAVGQTFRLHATGTMSTTVPTSAGGHLVLSTYFHWISNSLLGTIPAGLAGAPFEISATVTLVEVWPGTGVRTSSFFKITVGGVDYASSQTGAYFQFMPPLGAPCTIDWGFVWGDAGNSLTVSTLTTEWLR